MIPPAFDYHAPHTVAEAISLLTSHGDEAKLLAGGHSLLPMMKLRFAAPGVLIDINRIPELRGISEEGGVIRIGAMTSENELIDSALLKEKLPLLGEAAKLIADPQVRNRGTIGGDIGAQPASLENHVLQGKSSRGSNGCTIAVRDYYCHVFPVWLLGACEFVLVIVGHVGVEYVKYERDCAYD